MISSFDFSNIRLVNGAKLKSYEGKICCHEKFLFNTNATTS